MCEHSPWLLLLAVVCTASEASPPSAAAQHSPPPSPSAECSSSHWLQATLQASCAVANRTCVAGLENISHAWSVAFDDPSALRGGTVATALLHSNCDSTPYACVSAPFSSVSYHSECGLWVYPGCEAGSYDSEYHSVRPEMRAGSRVTLGHPALAGDWVVAPKDAYSCAGNAFLVYRADLQPHGVGLSEGTFDPPYSGLVECKSVRVSKEALLHENYRDEFGTYSYRSCDHTTSALTTAGIGGGAAALVVLLLLSMGILFHHKSKQHRSLKAGHPRPPVAVAQEDIQLSTNHRPVLATEPAVAPVVVVSGIAVPQRGRATIPQAVVVEAVHAPAGSEFDESKEAPPSYHSHYEQGTSHAATGFNYPAI
ncbi:hypothetical protein AB1Y20_007089 [Prymnesium parvum]|uniref:Uncharacterized protein n=1 Tax=Prymnesium parvum TaxID=97485 RepID=A0AB34J2F1_PRYPA